jgi:hypothetical protein
MKVPIRRISQNVDSDWIWIQGGLSPFLGPNFIKFCDEKVNLVIFFMYQRPILCTLYGSVLKKGCWGGGGGGGVGGWGCTSLCTNNTPPPPHPTALLKGRIFIL